MLQFDSYFYLFYNFYICREVHEIFLNMNQWSSLFFLLNTILLDAKMLFVKTGVTHMAYIDLHSKLVATLSDMFLWRYLFKPQ